MWCCTTNKNTVSSGSLRIKKPKKSEPYEFDHIYDEVLWFLERHPGATLNQMTKILSASDDTITGYDVLQAVYHLKRKGLVIREDELGDSRWFRS